MMRWIPLFLAGSIAACVPASGEGFERKWTEDVLLSDGTMMVVDRTVVVEETNSLAGDAYNAVEREATIKFTGKLAAIPKWSVPLTALVLYRSEAPGEWVVIATTSSCEVMYEYGLTRVLFEPGRPQTRYFEFRVRGLRWARVPLSRESLGRQTNLLFSYKDLVANHVTVELRRRLDGDERISSKYREVRVDPSRPNCTRSSDSRWIWEAEDRLLAALDEKHATDEERKRVVELVGGTTFPMTWFKGNIPVDFQPDTDPGTVQSLVTSYSGHSHVSSDGQVMYRMSEPFNEERERDLFWESYSNRMKSVGLSRFLN